ncbi:MAG: sugar transporter permease [Eubacterium sp.]|nr:sugar transporter permease [Eubacterium sp.]
MANFKRTREDLIIDVLSTAVALIVLVATLYPVYYCLIYSFNEGTDAAMGSFYLFPRKFTFSNYVTVLKQKSLFLSFSMTAARTLVGTATSVLFTAIVSYALSKKYLMFRRTYMLIGIVTLYFSGGLVPNYLLLKQLHLLNNFLVYIIPSLLSFFNVLLFIAFFSELPEALEESARIDGAGNFTLFFKIVLPLSAPVMATIALFNGVSHWNDWFAPAYYITNEKLITLPAFLMRIMSLAAAQQEMQRHVNSAVPTSTPESIRYATLVVAIAPITIIYPFIQKYFVKGMMVGSIKA